MEFQAIQIVLQSGILAIIVSVLGVTLSVVFRAGTIYRTISDVEQRVVRIEDGQKFIYNSLNNIAKTVGEIDNRLVGVERRYGSS